MKILARVNEHDHDMIEIYSERKTYLFTVVHIDCFWDEEDVEIKGVYDRLNSGEEGDEIMLDVKLSEKG